MIAVAVTFLLLLFVGVDVIADCLPLNKERAREKKKRKDARGNHLTRQTCVWAEGEYKQKTFAAFYS